MLKQKDNRSWFLGTGNAAMCKTRFSSDNCYKPYTGMFKLQKKTIIPSKLFEIQNTDKTHQNTFCECLVKFPREVQKCRCCTQKNCLSLLVHPPTYPNLMTRFFLRKKKTCTIMDEIYIYLYFLQTEEHKTKTQRENLV